MPPDVVERELVHVRKLLAGGRDGDATLVLSSLRPADRADLFGRLLPAQQDALLSELDDSVAAGTLQDLEDEQAAEVAMRVDSVRLARIVDTMEPDEAADLLNDLDPAYSSAVLDLMGARAEVQPLLVYPDDTAGGLMRADYLPLRLDMTAQDALDMMRKHVPRGKQSPHFVVVDHENRLFGIVSVFKVLDADRVALMQDLMDPDVLKAHVWDPAEEAAHLVARYRLDSVPVVDEGDRLLGVITADDLVDVLEKAATEDYQRFGGSAPLRRRYLSVSPLVAAWKRIGWLGLLFATGALTATIIRVNQGSIDRAVALAAFIPLLIGSGGNAGSQTIATVIRALATRDVAPSDALQVLWREFRTALLLGLVMSTGGYVVAQLSGAGQLVSLAVAASLLAILIWSNMVGALLPLAARAVGIDPALISGPLMSTLVDTIGLLIYFAIARMLLA